VICHSLLDIYSRENGIYVLLWVGKVPFHGLKCEKLDSQPVALWEIVRTLRGGASWALVAHASNPRYFVRLRLISMSEI
jgi:hypothetical protein